MQRRTSPSPWPRALAFVVGTYGATWLLWFFLRQPASAGRLGAIFAFIFGLNGGSPQKPILTVDDGAYAAGAHTPSILQPR